MMDELSSATRPFGLSCAVVTTVLLATSRPSNAQAPFHFAHRTPIRSSTSIPAAVESGDLAVAAP
jgi:hypothetical protein